MRRICIIVRIQKNNPDFSIYILLISWQWYALSECSCYDLWNKCSVAESITASNTLNTADSVSKPTPPTSNFESYSFAAYLHLLYTQSVVPAPGHINIVWLRHPGYHRLTQPITCIDCHTARVTRHRFLSEQHTWKTGAGQVLNTYLLNTFTWYQKHPEMCHLQVGKLWYNSQFFKIINSLIISHYGGFATLTLPDSFSTDVKKGQIKSILKEKKYQ